MSGSHWISIAIELRWDLPTQMDVDLNIDELSPAADEMRDEIDEMDEMIEAEMFGEALWSADDW